MKWKSLIILIGILFVFIGVCVLFPSKECFSNTTSTTGPNGNVNTYTGPGGNNASTYTGPNGTTYLGGSSGLTNGTSSSNTYTGPGGNSASTYTGPGGNSAVSTSSSNGNGTTYTGPNGNSITINKDSPNSNSNSNSNSLMNSLASFFGTTSTTTGSQGGSATTYQGNHGFKAAKVQGPNGNTYTATNANTNTNTNTSLSNNYDNYSHYSGTNYPLIYYGPNGGTARIIKTANEDTIVVTSTNGQTDIYYIDNNSNNTNVSVSKYEGPNGSSAKMITNSDGKMAVEITGPDGNKVVYTEDNTSNQPSDEYDNVEVNTYSGPRGGQAASVTGPAGNTAGAVQGPNGNTLSGNTYDSNSYYNSLPKGIPKSQIYDGEEDLYILKSEVVPPVCPMCPAPILKCPGGQDLNDVPPCPPCARCPEPAFDCKKVPNYNGGASDYLPVPVLNDFSTFGM